MGVVSLVTLYTHNLGTDLASVLCPSGLFEYQHEDVGERAGVRKNYGCQISALQATRTIS